ncbi:hypothetical protein GT037_009524 [Alternaria burnsii]|uniref:Uncharacterized protein n=1 Tax=Alternaria burnsii TaxID=1187904 RepID=A0A8H7EC30_9PLEO|nr:uncharacterized protein GT037_009524 [Alternaria burnsii]KAF7672493.1 hypothetical protein GT037_009524 [Alternaria burnsii]
MSKLIELGRAVLSSPATNHELWLTTLITLSSREDATYLQRLTSPQCLDFLISGKTWVKRGQHMHIEIRLNLREDSLPDKQLQDLADAVLHAPVWDQLMLKPTQRTDTAMDPGTIRLDVNHASAMGMQGKKERHRLFLDVPAADIRPPEGIAEISLHTVRLCVDILETSPRRRSTTKRSNSPRSERRVSALDEEESDTLLHEMASENLLHDIDTDRSQTAVRALACRKRKRSATETVVSTQSHSPDKDKTLKRPRKRLIVDSSIQLGWKAKASTFRLGLADVAPAIWRTGYLVAMSQRACLIPTIARSLARIDSVNSMSISLRDKMKRLSPMAQETWSSLPSDKWPILGYDAAENNLAIAGRLWVISQRSLLDKPLVSIQACINSSHPDHPVSDDMLAEEEPLWHYSRRTTPDQDNHPRELSNDVLPPAGYAQTNPQHGRSIGSPYLNIDVRESEDDLLLDSYPQNTMANTFCSADMHFRTPDISDEDLLPALHVPN